MIELDRAKSDRDRHTCSNHPAHVNTMSFDMTTEEGRMAYEYARLGEQSHNVIFKLWDEMCNHQNDCRGPDQITELWLQRLLEIIDELNVPLEV